MVVILDPFSGVYRVEDDPYVQELPADAVPAETRRLAEGALGIAVAELGLDDGVGIRWFARESEASRRLRQKHGVKGLPWRTFPADDDLQGITFGAEPDTIWIRATLDPLDASVAALHEARHVKQFADFVAGVPGALDMAGSSPHADRLAEIDARAWTREILWRLEQEYWQVVGASEAPAV